MAAIARGVGRALRPVVARWRRYWDVDHVARDFRSPDEHAEWLEAARESNRRIRAATMRAYAREHILPRVVLAEDSVLPRIQPVRGAEGL